MANSTTNLDTISSSQAAKEVTANAVFDAASQATTYGRRATTTIALTWGFYGGNVTVTAGTMSQIANGTVALTASNTNYVVALKSSGAVSASTATTNWNDTTNYWRLYSIVAGASTVTSYTDSRQPALYSGMMNGAFVGYTAGVGGTVTQATSRVTGVTLNKVTGAITLASEAGSTTPQTFTVTNSAVAATDVVVASQKSGTDKYVVLVTAVAAGSFALTIYTTGGTTTEQPVINFAVIKGVAA